MNDILYPHGGSADHGCEARLRSMLRLLPGTSVKVYSDVPEEDLTYWPHPVFSLRSAHRQVHVPQACRRSSPSLTVQLPWTY